MKRRIPLIIIVVLLATLIYPIMAISQDVFTRDALITGGGIITVRSSQDGFEPFRAGRRPMVWM